MSSPVSNQSGMALLVTLILITLMALLAFSGSENTRLQQRLASNDQAAQIAFQAAEAALKEVIETISSDAKGFIATCGTGEYKRGCRKLDDDDKPIEEMESDWTGAKTIGLTLNYWKDDALAKQPEYTMLMESLDMLGTDEGYLGNNDILLFRIWAKGYGPQGKMFRIIEARYVYKM